MRFLLQRQKSGKHALPSSQRVVTQDRVIHIGVNNEDLPRRTLDDARDLGVRSVNLSRHDRSANWFGLCATGRFCGSDRAVQKEVNVTRAMISTHSPKLPHRDIELYSIAQPTDLPAKLVMRPNHRSTSGSARSHSAS